MKVIDLINYLKEMSDEDQQNLYVCVQVVEINNETNTVAYKYPVEMRELNLNKPGKSIVFSPSLR